MSEGSRSTEDKVLQAAGIVAAAKGGIKIVAAMKMAGFSTIETKAMRTYQQVRRKAQQMVVVDTTVETVIPRVISSNKRSGGTSVISSLTSENAATSMVMGMMRLALLQMMMKRCQHQGVYWRKRRMMQQPLHRKSLGVRHEMSMPHKQKRQKEKGLNHWH